jgi:hypothetical protein
MPLLERLVERRVRGEECKTIPLEGPNPQVLLVLLNVILGTCPDVRQGWQGVEVEYLEPTRLGKILGRDKRTKVTVIFEGREKDRDKIAKRARAVLEVL